MLGDLVRIRHGFAFKTRHVSDSPARYRLFTRKNVVPGGGFREEVPRYYHGPVDERFLLSGGEMMVVLTDLSKGGDLLGFPARVPTNDQITYLHNQRIGRVELVNERAASPRYLYWLLCSPGYRDHVLRTATQTTVLDSAPSRIEAFQFRLPPLEEQERIAGVLDALGDRAEHNRAVAERLDECVSLYFKHLVARSTEWPLTRVGAELEVSLGGTPARGTDAYWQDGTIAWINSGKANDFRVTTPSEFITDAGLENSATKLLASGATIVAITGATMGKVSRLEIDACANQSIVGVLGSARFPDEFVYCWMRASVDELLTRQTGAAQQHVNKRDIESLDLRVPPPAMLDKFLSIARPGFLLIRSALFEAEKLAWIRDALLPKLVSGRIRVPESYDPDVVLSTVVEQLKQARNTQ